MSTINIQALADDAAVFAGTPATVAYRVEEDGVQIVADLGTRAEDAPTDEAEISTYHAGLLADDSGAFVEVTEGMTEGEITAALRDAFESARESAGSEAEADEDA